MFNQQFFTFRILVLSVLFVMTATITLPLQAKVLYVSDELKVPMRSGASNGHRIVKFLVSGAALTVIEVSEDGNFTHVEASGGKTGWVLN